MKKAVSLIVGVIFLGGVLNLNAITESIGGGLGTPCSHDLSRKRFERNKTSRKAPPVDLAQRGKERKEQLDDLKYWTSLAKGRIERIKEYQSFLVAAKTEQRCRHLQWTGDCYEVTEYKLAGDAKVMRGRIDYLDGRYFWLFRDLRVIVDSLWQYESKYPEALVSMDHHDARLVVGSSDLKQAYNKLDEGYNNTNFFGVLKNQNLTAEDLLEFVNGPVVSLTVEEPNHVKQRTRDNPKFGKNNVRAQLLDNPALGTIERALEAILQLQ